MGNEPYDNYAAWAFALLPLALGVLVFFLPLLRGRGGRRRWGWRSTGDADEK